MLERSAKGSAASNCRALSVDFFAHSTSCDSWGKKNLDRSSLSMLLIDMFNAGVCNVMNSLGRNHIQPDCIVILFDAAVCLISYK